MTATVTPPAGDQADPTIDEVVGGGRRVRADDPGSSQGTAELLLVGLHLATLGGLVRLFDDLTYMRTALPALALAHLLAAGARRLRWGDGSALLLGLGTMLAVVPWLLYADTTSWLLPTAGTWDAMVEDLRAGWDAFGEVKAPAEPLAGFLLVTVVATWVVAWLGDTLAFRYLTAVEALLPAAGVFVFASALSAERWRIPSAAAFLGAALLFVLAHRGWLAEQAPGWLPAGRRSGAALLLRSGAVVVAGVVGLGAVAGPLVPGAGEDALVEGLDDGGPSRRVTLSPLVDIQGRLTNQSDTEAFRVEASEPAYWRMTGLDTFDGRVWSSSSTVRPVDGDLPRPPEGLATTTVEQVFTITGLDVIWMPAAFHPVEVRGGRSVSFDRDSSSLLTGEDTVSTQVYSITSMRPIPDAVTLSRADGPVPDDIAERYLALPDDFPDELRQLARERTAGADDRYAQALALQSWFRSEFTYDLTVRAGHDDDAIERFIEARAGYCEQFAGTFAALARSLGIPARVAVGFTPGEAVGPASYVVRGRNAHAWPEVWFDGLGWIPFEPTPQRGIPGAEGYTGVPAQQEPGSEGPVGTDTTVPVSTDFEEPIDPEAFATTATGAATSAAPTTAPTTASGPGPWPGRLAVAAGLVAGVLALLVLVGPALDLARRTRRRSRARTDEARVMVAWAEATDAFGRSGVRPTPAETPREFARRAASTTGVDRTVADRLADDVTAAAWGGGTGPEVVERSRSAVATLERALQADISRRDRMKRSLDPRRRLPTGPRQLH